jgi:hypothetical protein
VDEAIRTMLEDIDCDKANVKSLQLAIKEKEGKFLQYLVQHNPELITINWAMIRRRLNMVERYKHQHEHKHK